MLRSMQRLRYNRGSPIASFVADRSNLGSGEDACVVVTAWGALLEYGQQNDFQAPFTTEAAIKIAEVIVPLLHAGKVLSNARKEAISAGSVAASWMTNGPTTMGQQEQALQKIYGQLQSHVPSEAAIRGVYNYVATVARRHNGDNLGFGREHVMRELMVEDDPRFTLDLPAETNIQKLELLKIGGNAIVNRFLANADSVNIWEQLTHNLGNNTRIDENFVLDIIPDAERAVEWRQLSDLTRVAFYHIMGLREGAQLVAKAVGYLVLSVLQLTKSSNVTDAYMDRRVEQIEREFGGLNINNIVTHDVIREFGSLFPTSKLTADTVYGILTVYYTLFTETELGPMKWMVEQSAASNVSSALAVAEMIAKNRTATFRKIAEIIGLNQVARWATLVANLAYDRFVSIVSPPVKIIEYPDLAYLGVRVSFGMGKPGVGGGGYQGKPDQMATLSKAVLDRLAEHITSQSDVDIDSRMGLVSDLKGRFAHGEVIAIEDEFYVIPRPGVDPGALLAELNAQPGNQAAAPVQQADHPQPADDDEVDQQQFIREAIARATRAERAGWHRTLRNAPPGTLRLTTTEAATVIRGMNTNREWYDALLMVADTMVRLARQESLMVLLGDRLNPVQRRVQLTQDFTAAVITLGGIIEPEWIRVPNPIAPVEPNQRDIHINQYVRTWFPFDDPNLLNIGNPRRGNAGPQQRGGGGIPPNIMQPPQVAVNPGGAYAPIGGNAGGLGGIGAGQGGIGAGFPGVHGNNGNGGPQPGEEDLMEAPLGNIFNQNNI